MYPGYLGLASIAAMFRAVHPVTGFGGGYFTGSAFSRAAMAGMPSLSTTRQVKTWPMTGARTGSRTSRALVRPWAALNGTGCGMRSASNPYGGGADVPAVQGMLDQPFPDLFLELEPVPFRDALLDPADEYGGRVDAFDIGRLVGGEQRDSLAGEFFFQFQRVEHVAAGSFDVFAHHGGERGGGGFTQQVGKRAVTWRKSSYSGNNGGQCVEVGAAALLIAVRDSKDPHGPVLAFGPHDWQQFTDRVKADA